MQGVDLGKKASTLKEKIQARMQLVGAPLLTSQIGALEFRERLMKGDNSAVQNLRMGTNTTVAELLKTLGQIPPLSLLHLSNPEFANYTREHVLQINNDLDFVQDVLSAAGKSKRLNPLLHSVLAGFSRRKKSGRSKCGQLNMHFDQLRFADKKTDEDEDLRSKDVLKTQKDKQRNTNEICKFYQQPQGCRYKKDSCRMSHRCVICNA